MSDYWEEQERHEMRAEWEDSLVAENAKLRELMYNRASTYAIEHMTEDELRITAANVMEDNSKLRELVAEMWRHKEALPYGLARYVQDRMAELGIEIMKEVDAR